MPDPTNSVSALPFTAILGRIDSPTVPQPEAVPHPVTLLGPSSKVGLAEPEGVAVITVMVFCVDDIGPDTEFEEAETIIVVLEMTMTDDTEERMLDREPDEAPKDEDKDEGELVDEDDDKEELELEEELEEVELELLLLLLEVEESDSDIDDVCV